MDNMTFNYRYYVSCFAIDLYLSKIHLSNIITFIFKSSDMNTFDNIKMGVWWSTYSFFALSIFERNLNLKYGIFIVAAFQFIL